MSFTVSVLGLIAVMAPLGALNASPAIGMNGDPVFVRPGAFAPSVAGPLISWILLVMGCVASRSLFCSLHVSGPSFELFAAVAMLPLALRLFMTGASMASPAPSTSERKTRMGFLWTLPIGPPAIILSIVDAARFGVLFAIASSTVAVAISAALYVSLSRVHRLRRDLSSRLGRLSGAFVIVTAVELAHHAVYSV